MVANSSSVCETLHALVAANTAICDDCRLPYRHPKWHIQRKQIQDYELTQTPLTVSGGFAIVQPGSVLSINAVEGFPLEDFSAEVQNSHQITREAELTTPLMTGCSIADHGGSKDSQWRWE